jgi:hypothetical protein
MKQVENTIEYYPNGRQKHIVIEEEGNKSA